MGISHYENFPVGSLLLPRKFRRPIALIYRFAREADDLADEGDLPAPTRLAQLERFREQLRRIESGLARSIPLRSSAITVPSGASARCSSQPTCPVLPGTRMRNISEWGIVNR